MSDCKKYIVRYKISLHDVQLLFKVIQSSEPEENGFKKEESGDSDVKLVTGGESSSQSKREYMNVP